MAVLDSLLRIVVFASGVWLVAYTVSAAVRSFVVPRSDNVWLTRQVFINVNRMMRLWLHRTLTYEERDRYMAFFAPLCLLLLPVIWLIIVSIGYTLMYWAVGVRPVLDAYRLSGSSLLTLGFRYEGEWYNILLAFSEATIGLGLVALLIAYLPTMYSAFSRRERDVALLEVRAGSPPSALEMLLRYNRIHGLEALGDMWRTWEVWFAEIEETHTSLAPLVFFRSPKPERSWITAAGAVLDAASITASTLDIPPQFSANLCIRAGFLALRSIADFFFISYDRDPKPTDMISVAKEEFDDVYEQLKAAGIPVKPDREQCWRDFQGWRVNYDRVLLALATLTMAPYAPWSSDRSIPRSQL